MLKDQIIASNIPYQVYRSNYKSLLFEEEAEILGIQSYYQYYKGEKYNKYQEISRTELKLLNISIADKKAIFECIFNNKYENVSLGLENKLKI